jgi:hypothetical protein
MAPRPITHRYVDPLDVVWLAAAQRMGFRVVRAEDVYAASDGRGTIHIGAPDTLDPDDCLAQMIFHELCHSLVEGAGALDRPDWGLDNVSPGGAEREHACLRLQAHLAEAHGLRQVLAPTTEFRAYYDGLGEPLAPSTDPSAQLARRALARVDVPPWGPHLGRALEATAAIVDATARVGAAEVVDERGRPALHARFSRARAAGSP